MINLTEKAQIEVKRLISQHKPGTFVRVGVKGGGCSGLTYDIKFEDQLNESDRVYELGGVKVVCDPKSFIYLYGMTVDFSTDLVGGGFKFINPNASGTCGCGTSFSV